MEPANWEAAFERFRNGFAEAMDPRLFTIEWLDEGVRSGAILFWHTDDAAITADIRVYPTNARVLHGLYATGSLLDIIEQLIPTAEAFAREQGCRWAQIDSRQAWGRMLSGKGYGPYKTAILKDLADG